MEPLRSSRSLIAAAVLLLGGSGALGAQLPVPDHLALGTVTEAVAHEGRSPGVSPAGHRGITASLQSDSAAVAEVIHRFHTALEEGDSTGALALLTDHVIVLESGAIETREEYRAHHLASDIAFAQAVPRESGPVRVVVRGDAAWATSASVTRGTFRDRAINSQSVELMVLERTGEGWRIAAIHWSSRTLRS